MDNVEEVNNNIEEVSSNTESTSKCTKCEISKCTKIQCPPKGTDNPVIYFIGEAPGPQEHTDGEFFIGKAGQYLHTILDQFGLNVNNCRFNNVVRCFPKDENSDSFRAPNDTEIQNCIPYLIEDIKNTNPKVIVTLGSTSMKALFPEINTGITKNVNKDAKEYLGIPTVTTYHPSYLMRNSNNKITHDQFKNDIKYAIDIASKGIIHRESVTKNKINNSETVLCLTYRDFDDFCQEYIDNATTVGYDIEASSLETHTTDYRVVGFSLASSPAIGCYVPLLAIDYKMNDLDKRLIEKRLAQILISRHVIVYNSQHELPATLNWLGVEIPDWEDLFVAVKVLTGSMSTHYSGSRGLKNQTVERLGYLDWSKDVEAYFNLLSDFVNKKVEIIGLLKNYYESYEIDDTYKIISDRMDEVGPKGALNYGDIPFKLIGRYGSLDSSILFELRDNLYEAMRKESEIFNMDIFTGYKYWLWHHYAGYTLEKNGALWNEEKAKKLEDWCTSSMEECIRNLIRSPLTEPHIHASVHKEFLAYLMDNHLEEILGSDYTPVRKYKEKIDVKPLNKAAVDKLHSMSLEEKTRKKPKTGELINTGVYGIMLGNLETLAKDFLNKNPNIYKDWYTNYMDTLLNDPTKTIADYKKIINPSATLPGFKDFVSSILVQPYIRMGMMLRALENIVEDPKFYIEYYQDIRIGNKSFNSVKYSQDFDIEKFRLEHPDATYTDSDDSILLRFMLKLKNSGLSPKDKMSTFVSYFNSPSGSSDFKYKRVIKAISESMSYNLGSLDANELNNVYEMYVMNGIDVDDPSTWTDEFTWYFNFIKFKKLFKINTTFINGVTGRRAVYEADKESFTRGDYFTPREKKFDGSPLPDDKVYVLQQDFSINTKDTGRWASSLHNLPASDAVKGIYTSRFKGGCIAMPDGCLVANTKILMEDGSYKEIKDLLDKKSFKVMSYDDSTNSFVVGNGSKCREVKKVKKLAKVTLNTGETILCTLDHKFLSSQDNTMKEIQNFNIGESIKTFR